MSMRQIQPAGPVLSTTVSASNASSSPFYLANMFSPQVAYIVSVGAGLTATFKLQVSQDGTTYYDSGQVLPSTGGSATQFPVQYSGAFPYVRIQCVYGSGTGTVTITGSAKGGA